MNKIELQVQVGKDRALDDLADLIHSKNGYFNFTESDKIIMTNIARLLLLEDNLDSTLSCARDLGYINNEEELFFPQST